MGSVIGIIGVCLTLVGTIFQSLFPWITFKKGLVFPLPTPKPWRWVYYQISPFIIRYQLEGDIVQEQWFYKMDTTLIGAICIIGAIIGLIGVFTNIRKINLAGGIMIMFALIGFGTCLPGLYPYIAWESGAKLTFFGSIMLISSAVIGYLKD